MRWRSLRGWQETDGKILSYTREYKAIKDREDAGR